jgi:hypothetical protein
MEVRRNCKMNEDGRPINLTEGISVFVGVEGIGGMEINSCSPPPPWRLMLPCQAKGKASSKRACNLSVSSRPRVPNYKIGQDRGEE